ncbi:hypothetical protein CDAR_32501 [Caerostris darwini]|uniref:Uncharacterized protein n=1 Tax=Caerostris darwini TaxID=1538125 RepID=A0AAV4WMW1_9ARAC|nr:hypothetical protein CDAR_32501 [Caerostris darwini]
MWYSDRSNNCINYIVNSMCGEEALLFRKQFSNISSSLVRKACEEVYPNKNTATDGINPTYMENGGFSVQLRFSYSMHLFATVGPHITFTLLSCLFTVLLRL